MNLKSFDGHLGTLEVREFESAAIEAVSVAAGIKVAIAIGPTSPAQFAVLSRTHAIANAIAESLIYHMVPVRVRRMAPPPVDWPLARAALDALAKPRSADRAKRYAAMANPARAAAMTLEFEKAQRPFRLETPVTGDADKMGDELRAMGVSGPSVELVLARFAELPTSASLADLAASLALDPPAVDDGDGVFCGTIHAAKGAEWDNVVLAGFEDEAIPGKGKRRDVEEERRVAYVGLTRARKNVRVTWARWRPAPWPGMGNDRTPSRFIKEVLE
jgi:DNA helicase-2/ATP-dependent DNA helicase PcrA